MKTPEAQPGKPNWMPMKPQAAEGEAREIALDASDAVHADTLALTLALADALEALAAALEAQ